MAEKKKHHYVPQFLLRKFSPDQSSLKMFLSGTGKFIPQASIAHQCQKDNFYGKEKDLEDAFGKLETATANILNDLDQSKIDALSDSDVEMIREFVHFQNLRTLRSAEDISDMMDGMMKSILKEDPRLDDEMKQFLDVVEIKRTDAQFDSLYQAASTFPLLKDLKLKFILNTKEIDFILSDHPVVLCNQWSENHPRFSSYPGRGLSSKGLMIFMPITPKICLMFFDASTYAVGAELSNTVGLGLKDIRLLNRMQILHANTCIYCLNEATVGFPLEQEIKTTKDSKPKSRVAETGTLEKPDGTKSKLIIGNTKEVRLEAKFSFVRVTDGNKFDRYNKVVLPVRSQELLDLSKRLGEEMDKAVNERVEQQKKSV